MKQMSEQMFTICLKHFGIMIMGTGHFVSCVAANEKARAAAAAATNKIGSGGLIPVSAAASDMPNTRSGQAGCRLRIEPVESG